LYTVSPVTIPVPSELALMIKDQGEKDAVTVCHSQARMELNWTITSVKEHSENGRGPQREPRVREEEEVG
jgi:hypothetical protein